MESRSEFVFSEKGFEERFKQLRLAMEGESSRAQILIFSAHLDDLLEQILKKFLKPPREKEKNDELFARNRPLSSFSSHISAAYRMGLISSDDSDALDVLRDIRNDCAHSMTAVSLTSNEYKDRCKRFVELASRGQDRVFMLCGFMCPQTDAAAVIACCMILIISFERLLLAVTEAPSLETPQIFELRSQE
jgi:hypothetical protein